MAERFYSRDALTPDANLLTLDGDQAHHLVRVRRVKVGERVEVFDGCGNATAAEVIAVEKTRVTLHPVGLPLPDRRPALDLILATAVPKGERFDWLVEKASELGVARLVPLLTERSVVDPGRAKLERLRKACIESAKQCGRNRLLDIAEPLSWSEAVGSFGDVSTRLFAHLDGLPFGQWPLAEAGTRVVVAVGPEGGWSETEAASATAAGWRSIGLGPMILRVETAAVRAAACVLAAVEPSS